MTATDVTNILQRLAVIETKIDLGTSQEPRLSKVEATVNKMLGALILLAAMDAGGIAWYLIAKAAG